MVGGVCEGEVGMGGICGRRGWRGGGSWASFPGSALSCPGNRIRLRYEDRKGTVMTTRQQALNAETSLSQVDVETASLLSRVAERTVRGEFRGAPNLWKRLPSDDRSQWIGTLIEVPSEGAPIERSVVLSGKKCHAIRRFLKSSGMPALTEMNGREVTLGVGLTIGASGTIDLDLHRVLDIGAVGPWSQWLSAHRSRVQLPSATSENPSQRKAQLLIDRAPRRIVVIAPQKGSAGRTDIESQLGDDSGLTKRTSVDFIEAQFGGRGADGHIAKVIAESAPQADLLLIARGGGKRTDLWPFDTAVVATAIQRATEQHGTHVVTALGHHRDVTLADKVASSSFAVPYKAADRIRQKCWTMLDEQSASKARPRTRRLSPQYARAASSDSSSAAQLKRTVSELTVARNQLQQQLNTSQREHELSMLTILASTVPTSRHINALRDMRRAVNLRWVAALAFLLAMPCAAMALAGWGSDSCTTWGIATAFLTLSAAGAGVMSRRRRRRALQDVPTSSARTS